MPVISTEAKRSGETCSLRPALVACVGALIGSLQNSAQRQAPPPKPAFFVTIGPETQKVSLGTKVRVKATIVSTADVFDTTGRGAMVGCSGVDTIHIEMEGGKEPEKTEYYRHLLGDFRPGDSPYQNSGSCFARELRIGGALPATYDLSYYYQLNKPGRYDVWISINDQVRDLSDGNYQFIPVRSNTARFELVQSK